MSYYFESIDKKKIFVNDWTIPNPIGTVQIIHGMAEYGKRYEEFARFLNEKGYSVFATDHRGHGNTKETNELFGDIGEDGFNLMVEDEIFLAKDIKRKNNVPHILLGHSMGSFIAQSFVQKEGKLIDGLILSGSSCGMELEAWGGEILARIEMRLFGLKPSKLLDKLSFGSFNKGTDQITSFDWLNRNIEEDKKYIADKFCGFISPNRFFIYFLSSLKSLWKKKNMSKVPKTLPLLIFSGDRDPVGKYGKGVKLLHNKYKDVGITNLSFKLYEGGRHEMLKEINKVEVFKDVYNWIQKNT